MARQGLSSLDDVVSANATARLMAYVEEASVRELALASAAAKAPARPQRADQTDEFDTLALIDAHAHAQAQSESQSESQSL